MQSTERLAAAQTVAVAGDIEANVRDHLQFVEAAAAEGVRLLVFPELSLTGYELAAGPALAFDAQDARLAPLRDAARDHHVTLVVGAPARVESGLHIAAFVLEPEGDVHLYTKHHLGAFRPEDHPGGAVPPPEQDFFTPGAMNPMVAWRGRTLAVSICADSLYPSHAQAAADRGADIYLSCQFAIPAHMGFKLGCLKEAARRHALTVVVANYAGRAGGLLAAGGSCVHPASGETVARLPAEGRGLAIGWEEGGRWAGETVLLNSF